MEREQNNMNLQKAPFSPDVNRGRKDGGINVQSSPFGNGGVIADNLVKMYGTKKARVQALKGISFEVGKGELFGIIGPDGAGKTS